MEIEYLRQFMVLSKRLNFTAAADSLFITQSALSRHMAALEQELDIRLFHRNTQSVSLTPAGELFKERIDVILNDYDDTCARLRIMKSGYSSRLCIGVPYYALNQYLEDVPGKFELAYPDVKLQYSVGDPHEVTKLYARGKIDLAILAYYPTQNLARAKIIPAGTESLGVILSIEDPLAASASLPLKALAERTFFRVDNDYFFCAWRHISSLCRAAGFTPKGPALFNQMEALMMAVRRGDGVAILGQHMKEHLSEELVFVPLEGDEAQREICLIYNQENENQSIELFSKLYLEHVNAGDIPLLRHI